MEENILKRVLPSDIDPLGICERIGLLPDLQEKVSEQELDSTVFGIPSELPDLQEKVSEQELDPTVFGIPSELSDELNEAFQAFLTDFKAERLVDCEAGYEDKLPSPELVGIFIKSICMAESKHESRKKDKKLSSTNHLFKEDVDKKFRQELRKFPNVECNDKDYHAVTKFLSNKMLITILSDGYCITRELTKLLKESYGYIIL